MLWCVMPPCPCTPIPIPAFYRCTMRSISPPCARPCTCRPRYFSDRSSMLFLTASTTSVFDFAASVWGVDTTVPSISCRASPHARRIRRHSRSVADAAATSRSACSKLVFWKPRFDATTVVPPTVTRRIRHYDRRRCAKMTELQCVGDTLKGHTARLGAFGSRRRHSRDCRGVEKLLHHAGNTESRPPVGRRARRAHA
ncbi:hypothetical protein ACUXMH_004107 [Ralstonia pickettii]|nr:hypothetical protein R76696_04660 [Ralstonia mannitolilytica]SCW98798.1 hypothetical protein SAMN02799637_04941 [Ralstonia sp. UNCCL144]